MAYEKRTVYFDGLRLLATFAVILLHICARPWETQSIDSAEWAIFNVLDSAVRWCVPLFVMLSGALFLNPDKEVRFKTLCRKNILRIATAFFFWSAIYTAIEWGRGLHLRDLPLSFLKGEYHMWFLFLIAGLYLFVPLLRKITCSKKRTEWFLVLTGAFLILIPRLLNFLGLLGAAVPFLNVNTILMNINAVSFCYFFYFMLGHYLHQYDIAKDLRGVIYAFGFLGFAATAGLTFWHSQTVGMPSGMFFVYMSLGVMAMAVAIFIFGKYHFQKGSAWLSAASGYSFGIYLAHILVLDLLEWLGLTPMGLHPLLSVPLLGISVFLLSLLLSAVIHRIPVLKKYVV
ncbi:MAG: acyltransferase family protein [Clostridia bacterium]|nr:acyltransferase family protein [Clostridia bacterium]